MNDDQDIPVAHTWLFVSVLGACVVAMLMLLTACGTTPVVTTIKTPVPIQCQETVPDRPVMPTEGFTEKPAMDEYVRAARAEIERREGYEGQLRTALEACTAPLK